MNLKKKRQQYLERNKKKYTKIILKDIEEDYIKGDTCIFVYLDRYSKYLNSEEIKQVIVKYLDENKIKYSIKECYTISTEIDEEEEVYKYTIEIKEEE